jgi:uncharacterized repeat protein (TIGR03803 family)
MATFTTLFSFNSTNGAYPYGSLIADADGHLFGTTSQGGANSVGTVFEIAGYASPLETLITFKSGSTGINPQSSLIADASGNLFGTTYAGGTSGIGTVFEIAYLGDGTYANTPTTLVSFDATNGSFPYGSLMADANGNLFGTTFNGGANNDGTVFEIAKTSGGYASTPTTLVSFDATDGANPHSELIADASGNLFGTTVNGGASGDGAVFEIAYLGNGSYASTPTTLVSFDSTDGANPYAGLIADASGNLFGMTSAGGASGYYGTIFEIAKTSGGYASTPTTLVNLDFFDSGADPQGSLIMDANGNLFGTTSSGGAAGYGTVFELAKTASGYASSPTLLVSLNNTNGFGPDGSLFADSSGDLFGTTSFGGANGDGTVFEITDSGYVPCFATGTLIRTEAGDVAVEALRAGDMVATQRNDTIIFQPVTWIGRRRIDLKAHPRPATVAPVRISRGAFADEVPCRDLLVSPDHAILCDGKLICARQLINGSTIRQEQGLRAVEYFHVELNAHAVLLSEGLPTESYLDTGNRGVFANADEPLVLHPDLTGEADRPTREAASCAPFVWDDANVRPIWERLAERAAALGLAMAPVRTTTDPGLCIIAGGRTLQPVSIDDGVYRFVLPRGLTPVRLVSRVASPTDARPWAEDRRRLGVYVERIVLRGDGEVWDMPADHPSLSQGWWAAEGIGTTLRRWTNGDAILPLPVLNGPAMLEVRATNGGMAYPTDGEHRRQAA